jgi:DNA-binding response OmpR family regulator
MDKKEDVKNDIIEDVEEEVKEEKVEEDVPLKRIIYVDDVNYSLITIKERLKDSYEVYPTQSYEKMFEIMERIIPDLILLDVNMPDVDGYEIIKKIKADRRYTDIPVMFLSSKKDKKSIIRGMSLGAVDFITKPVTNDELFEYIEFHLDPDKRAAIKPVILAIDDSPSILHAINSILGDQYMIYTLPDVKVEQVLKELLKKTAPDLFLFDYNMPGLNGFDLIPIIRANPEHETTPIIILTSEKSIDHITVAVHLGACDYILKPIDADVLRKKVATHLADFIMHRRIRTVNNEKK